MLLLQKISRILHQHWVLLTVTVVLANCGLMSLNGSGQIPANLSGGQRMRQLLIKRRYIYNVERILLTPPFSLAMTEMTCAFVIPRRHCIVVNQTCTRATTKDNTDSLSVLTLQYTCVAITKVCIFPNITSLCCIFFLNMLRVFNNVSLFYPTV